MSEREPRRKRPGKGEETEPSAELKKAVDKAMERLKASASKGDMRFSGVKRLRL